MAKAKQRVRNPGKPRGTKAAIKAEGELNNLDQASPIGVRAREMTASEQEAIEREPAAPIEPKTLRDGRVVIRRMSDLLTSGATSCPASPAELLAYCHHWLASMADIDDASVIWTSAAEKIVKDAWAAAHRMKWNDMLPEPERPAAIADARKQLAAMRDRAWRQWRDGLPALSPTAALVYEILLGLKPYEALTAPELLREISCRDPRKVVEESTLRGRIQGELKPYGIENFKRIGYRIKPEKRP